MSAEPTYLEKLESYLIDEFHVGLLRVMEGIWSDIGHGDWYCHLEFFKSLSAQYEHVMRLRDKPLQLKIYLEHLNFSKRPGSQGGLAKEFARSWLPIYRQRIFLLNALHLILGERAADGENLNLAISVVRDLLHQHILTVFSFLENDFETGSFAAVHNRIEPFIETRDKAAFLIKAMTTLLQQHGFALDEVDGWHKQRILFRQHALEARFDEAFKDWETQRFFNCLHLEIERLLDLTYLENLSHSRSQSLDALTAVADRRSFNDEIKRWITRLEADGRPFVCAMIDLDYFKRINDDHGHLVGDFVLKCAAEFLQSNVSSTDFIARYGGEEFVVLLENTDLLQAKTKMDDVLSKLAASTFEYPVQEQKLRLAITASCGLAECGRGDNQSELIGRADKAVYEAKSRGRNQVVTSR
jgi:diguanylate cyclase (GGDEF)-like protein